jgi:hypothetical protein
LITVNLGFAKKDENVFRPDDEEQNFLRNVL